MHEALWVICSKEMAQNKNGIVSICSVSCIRDKGIIISMWTQEYVTTRIIVRFNEGFVCKVELLHVYFCM